jgi:hypothetical protein
VSPGRVGRAAVRVTCNILSELRANSSSVVDKKSCPQDQLKLFADDAWDWATTRLSHTSVYMGD